MCELLLTEFTCLTMPSVKSTRVPLVIEEYVFQYLSYKVLLVLVITSLMCELLTEFTCLTLPSLISTRVLVENAEYEFHYFSY